MIDSPWYTVLWYTMLWNLSLAGLSVQRGAWAGRTSDFSSAF